MVRVTIEIDDSTYRALEAGARSENLSIEELLSAWAAARLRQADEELEARDAARRHLERYPDLFRRLAD